LSDQRGPWRVRLTSAAVADLEQIGRWTEQRFGSRQAEVYKAVVEAALQDLAEGGPGGPGTRRRDDIRSGISALHVRRSRRGGRHIVVFRVDQGADGEAIEVLRVLHDAMDLRRHLPPDPDAG